MGRIRPKTGVEPLKTRIRVRFTFEGKKYRETLDLAPTPANIRAVERLMAKVFKEIELGVFDYAETFPDSQKKPTGRIFSVVALGWLETLTVEKSTFQDYDSAIRKIWIPLFGDRDIGSIKPSEIRKKIAERAREVTGKTINNNLIPLRAVFALAVGDSIIELSPLDKIENQPHQHPLPDPFDREEMERIIAHMRDRYDEQIWNWYEFAFGTGMRPSEQIALRWGDVDWKRRVIRVQRARVRHVIKSTKTRVARDIDLTDRMISVLQRQRAHSFMHGIDSPIFLNPVTNTPWPDSQDQRKLYFHPTLRATGIRMRDAYQTRHTYATTALMAGINPAYISRQLGHRSTAMLFKHYSRWIDGADGGREAAKLNELHGMNQVAQAN